jgi:hypothetical protein
MTGQEFADAATVTPRGDYWGPTPIWTFEFDGQSFDAYGATEADAASAVAAAYDEMAARAPQ